MPRGGARPGAGRKRTAKTAAQSAATTSAGLNSTGQQSQQSKRPKPPNAGKGRKKGVPNKRTQAVRERLLRDHELTAESTVEAIRRGALYDIRKFFDKKGNLRPLRELSEAEAWAIAGFEIVIKNVTAGDGKQDTVAKIKLMDRAKYVEMAAKHFGFLIEKVEHSGGIVLSHEVPE